MATNIEFDGLVEFGTVLKAMPKATGTVLAGRDSFGATKMEAPENNAPTLAELGINYKTSSLAQKLADFPEAEGQTGCTDIRSLDGVPYAGGDCRSGRIRDKTSW